MKRIWLVGALAFAVVGCDPNTKPTDTVRNETGDPVVDANGEETGERTGGFNISSIEVRVAGSTGDYGGNILGGALAPGEEGSITALDCEIYDVRFTDASGATCEFTEESGLGPYYLCFAHSIWALQGGIIGDCEDFVEIGSES